MFSENLMIAINEFIHVGVALIIIIALISVLTGVVREYIPQEKIQKKLGKHGNWDTVIGALLGTLTPFCSASMVPVSMGMIEMKIPFSTVLSFLVSAPITNFVVVGIIFAVFGWKVALLYFIWTFTAAVLAGLVLGNSGLKNDVKTVCVAEAPCCGLVDTPKSTRISCTLEEPIKIIENDCNMINSIQIVGTSCNASMMEIPDSVGFWELNRPRLARASLFAKALFLRILPYVLAGAAISGFTAAFVPTSIVEKYVGNRNVYAIPIAAAIGVPLYLRIEMAIPLLKVLMVKGMGIGAAMALLIGGTGASLPEIAILSAMLKPRAVAVYVLTVFMIATVGGYMFHFLLS